jgi:hypothetical protein
MVVRVCGCRERKQLPNSFDYTVIVANNMNILLLLGNNNKTITGREDGFCMRFENVKLYKFYPKRRFCAKYSISVCINFTLNAVFVRNIRFQYVNFQTFAVVHIFAVFFLLGDYPAYWLKFNPTFRDHYLSRHQVVPKRWFKF